MNTHVFANQNGGGRQDDADRGQRRGARRPRGDSPAARPRPAGVGHEGSRCRRRRALLGVADAMLEPDRFVLPPRWPRQSWGLILRLPRPRSRHETRIDLPLTGSCSDGSWSRATGRRRASAAPPPTAGGSTSHDASVHIRTRRAKKPADRVSVVAASRLTSLSRSPTGSCPGYAFRSVSIPETFLTSAENWTATRKCCERSLEGRRTAAKSYGHSVAPQRTRQSRKRRRPG